MVTALPEFEEPQAVSDDIAALRKLSSAVIRDAFRRIDRAKYAERLVRHGSRSQGFSEILTRAWSDLRCLDRDRDWFRSAGFAFWVSVLDLDPASIEAIPEAYEACSRPVARSLRALLERVDTAGAARREASADLPRGDGG